MSKKNLNIFTYDYPFIGNDSKFMIDEINFLSKRFDKINIIPIKKKKYKVKKLNKNIKINYDLIYEIYHPLYCFNKIINIFFCSYFWKEFVHLKTKNFFRKLRMIFTERYLAESVYSFVKKNPKIRNNLSYSIWSNHTLIGFYLLKKKKLIGKCFARTLGSDLKGFIPFDKYIAFKDIKFKKLDLIITLNSEQNKILHSQKLIKKNLILKNYLGINSQYNFKLFLEKKIINFASCGSLIHIKNNLEILKFITFFSKQNPNYKIRYYCIGKGPEKDQIINFAKKNLVNNLKFIHVEYTSSLVKFLKKKQINFFINLSFSEGMSFAVMEAISCSIPIICSNIAGNLEVVNDQNGYVVRNSYYETYNKISAKIIRDYEGKEYKKKCILNFNLAKKKISRKRNQLLLDKILRKLN